MKNVIAWIKTNPISVASFALMLLSVVAIAYFMFVANPPMREAAATEAEKHLRQAKQFTSQSIDVPPANADDPPETKSGITLNAPTIQVMQTIYSGLNRESDQTFQNAMDINQAGHEQMIPDLLPDADAGRAFEARTAYLNLLQAMVGGPRRAQEISAATGVEMPYLNAGPPLSQEAVQSHLAQQMDAMLKGTAANTTNPEQQQAEQRRELINELLRHAKTISLYADPELGNNPQQPNPDFPLQVASLGTTSTAPTPSQLWEGQFELWILKDIVRALAITNDVANLRDHGVDEDGNPIPSSVLNAPIKRLLRAEVLPGYVGLHNTGGVDQVGTATRGGRTGARPGGAYAPPVGGMTNQANETPLSDNFAFGPTGRSSNQLYDVRHVRLLMHADFARLPEFFNALGQVNMMTVLNMRMSALDEYELLNQQYMYGKGDVVEVEMIVETLWLRDWTAALMPEDVKVYVGLAEPPEDALPAGGFDPYGGYGDPAGGYGGYGGYGGGSEFGP